MRVDLSRTWKILEMKKIKDDSLGVECLDNTVGFYCGIDISKKRHYLVRIDSKIKYKDDYSKGFEIRVISLTNKINKEEFFIDVFCQDRERYDIFDVFGEKLLETLKKSDKRNAHTIQQYIVAWRKFWLGEKKQIMSEEKQQGLIGELLFLSRWVFNGFGIETALDSWEGPCSKRHDFIFGNCSIEVKTTIRENGIKHRVNGLEQLKKMKDKQLYLFSLKLLGDKSGEISLVVLVDEVEDKLMSSGISVDNFYELLDKYGYDEKHRESYNNRFSMSHQILFVVDEKFPKIISSDISKDFKNLLSNVKYDIELMGADATIMASDPSDSNVRRIFNNNG